MVISAWKELLLFVNLFMLFEYSTSIKLVELDVPRYLPLGARAALSCRWQLGPADVLYSVKWYKDGKEFFRYVPRDVEPRRKFTLSGVDVEDSDPSGARIVVSPATMETGGRYRCEVSGERPLFPTVSEHKDMAIVVLPDHGPQLSGLNSKYCIGDRVQTTCNSGPSKPATQLSWYINGEPLEGESTASYRSENGLIVTTVKLDFEVNEVHFRRNLLKVKCLATIPPVYWKSHEDTAILEKNIVYDIVTIGVTDTKDPEAVNSTKNILISLECMIGVIIAQIFC